MEDSRMTEMDFLSAQGAGEEWTAKRFLDMYDSLNDEEFYNVLDSLSREDLEIVCSVLKQEVCDYDEYEEFYDALDSLSREDLTSEIKDICIRLPKLFVENEVKNDVDAFGIILLIGVIIFPVLMFVCAGNAESEGWCDFFIMEGIFSILSIIGLFIP